MFIIIFIININNFNNKYNLIKIYNNLNILKLEIRNKIIIVLLIKLFKNSIMLNLNLSLIIKILKKIYQKNFQKIYKLYIKSKSYLI